MINFAFALLLLVPFAVSVHRLYRFRDRTINDVIPFLRHLALEDLDSLLDQRHEETLWETLSVSQFAKAQINRVHLLREKLCCADHNASILQDWAAYEFERTYVTCDQQVREIANALLQGCTEFRIAVFWIKFQLNLWYLQLKLFPIRNIPFISRLRKIDSFDLLESYRQVTKKAAVLAGTSGESYRLKLAELL
ncbi:MAG TPA: hypothetical protein VFY05_12440 [Candidatus Angelobacter sp.]|nr:hypothetical protein [Candidatus Angelobacter sp.]